MLMAMFDKFIDLYIRRTAIKTRRNGEMLIVMSERGEVQYLNETAAFLYERFDGSMTLREVFDLLLAEYDIAQQDIASVQQDAVNVIRDLQWQGLIEIRRNKTAA